MWEEALPTLWASVHSWLTPTVLFVLLNVVIGTIAVTSSRAHSHSHDSDSSDTTTATPTPKRLSLDRLKSFKIYSHRPTDAPLHTLPPPPPPPPTKPIQTSPSPPPPEPELTAPVEDEESHITRSRSDMEPAAGEMPGKLARKMKKSASAKSAFAHFDFREGGDIDEEAAAGAAEARRPATARTATARTATARTAAAPKEKEEDAEVDARADDFINKFRQQLKLQRLDSIVRYKEMLKRGSQA